MPFDPLFLLVLELNPQNVAHIALKEALLGLGAASLISLRPGFFGIVPPRYVETPKRGPTSSRPPQRGQRGEAPRREHNKALASVRSPPSG